MISLILSLAIVSSAFAFPANDLTEINTEQQDAFQQASHDSPVLNFGEKIEVQKPQGIPQQENFQPTLPEVNQVQSTVGEEAQKIVSQSSQQTSEISDSVHEYSSAQLVQLQPITSDLVLVSNPEQPVLLPYIAANPIQPLSVVPVKQVNDIIQGTGVPAREVTNIFIIPVIKSTEGKNTPVNIAGQNQVPHTTLTQSSEVPQPLTKIANVGQVGESTAESQNQVQTTKAENVNSLQNVQQNEKQVQGESQADEKQNFDQPSPVKPQGQEFSTPEVENKVEQTASQYQSVTLTQYDNVPQGLSEQTYYHQKGQLENEQQSNQHQPAELAQYGNAPQALNEQTHYQQKGQFENQQAANQHQPAILTHYSSTPQGLNEQTSYQQKGQLENQQAANQQQPAVLTQYVNAPQGLNEQTPYHQKSQFENEQQPNHHPSAVPTQYENAPQGLNEQTYYQQKGQFENQQAANQQQPAVLTQYLNAPQGLNEQTPYQPKGQLENEQGQHQPNHHQSAVLTQYANVPQIFNEQKPYEQTVQSEIAAPAEEQANQRQFNIKEEIQKVQAELQQEALGSGQTAEQNSQQNSYQQTSNSES